MLLTKKLFQQGFIVGKFVFALCCLCLWLVHYRFPLRCSLAFKNNIISKALSAIYKYLYTNGGIFNKSIMTGATSGVEIAYYTGTSYSLQFLVGVILFNFCFLCKVFLITLIPLVIVFTVILCSTASGYPLVSLSVY